MVASVAAGQVAAQAAGQAAAGQAAAGQVPAQVAGQAAAGQAAAGQVAAQAAGQTPEQAAGQVRVPVPAPVRTPTSVPVRTSAISRQLDRAQALLRIRLAGLPADSGVLVLRDPDRLTLRIPAGLLFEYDSALLRPPLAATPEPQAPSAAGLPVPLAACVQLMKRYRAMQAQIVVYTDSIGGVGLNQTLSDARAQAVDEALTAAGVAIERLQYRGAGAATMVADNQTPQGRIENRRVEIEFRPVPAAAP